jgi:hypothetical protein
MIHSDEQMQVNLELIRSMYGVIAKFRREIAPLNYRNYEIMAEGPIEQIRRLKQEIDEYLGIQPAMVREQEATPASAAD